MASKKVVLPDLENKTITLSSKNYKLGEKIGSGGFGIIYTAKLDDKKFVIKIEDSSSGGLFSETKCFQNMNLTNYANSIDERNKWMDKNNVPILPLPILEESGIITYTVGKTTFNLRGLVMTMLGSSLNNIYFSKYKHFQSCCIQIITALQYMHEHGYTHADIKPSNLCYSKKSSKIIYLIDFGISVRYNCDIKKNKIMEYKEDKRKLHDGTLEYTSIDAHRGVQGTRRGDLEILGYCLIELTGGVLPWKKYCEKLEKLHKEKKVVPKSVINEIQNSVYENKLKFYDPNGSSGVSSKISKLKVKQLLNISYEDIIDDIEPDIYNKLSKFFVYTFGLAYEDNIDYAKLKNLIQND